MIKVIRHGYSYHETRCCKCGCQFSFIESDLETVVFKEIGHTVKCLNCPECGELNIINRGDNYD